MVSTDESFSNTGKEPKDYFLTETFVESLTESTTGATVHRATVPRGRGLRRCHNRGDALQCTPRTSLSLPARRPVCWSVVVVRVRWIGAGQPVVERGQELNTELFWTDRRSKSSPTVRRKSGDTNSRLTMTEEAHKN